MSSIADNKKENQLPIAGSSRIRLVRSGLEFFELLENMIHQATLLIHVQVYIFAEDETGMRIASALMSAAKRKVNVFVVVDGYASQGLSEKLVNDLRSAGVYFRYFDPVLKSKYFYFGRRLHHKVIVSDNTALVGGINISNNYNHTVTNAAWLDWALYVEGPSVKTLRSICEERVKQHVGNYGDVTEYKSRSSPSPVKVNINDWVKGKREITKSYMDMLSNAKSNVIIMSSYFIPGEILRKHLKKAADRGVRVRIIVAGKSDVGLAKYAERYMYRWMLESNIEIYEYLPNILHGKIATCDSRWLTVGSYNINAISAYASIELNVAVHQKSFVKNAEERLEEIMTSHCRQVRSSELKKVSLLLRFLYRSAYAIFRLVLFLFTFYFKEQK